MILYHPTPELIEHEDGVTELVCYLDECGDGEITTLNEVRDLLTAIRDSRDPVGLAGSYLSLIGGEFYVPNQDFG